MGGGVFTISIGIYMSINLSVHLNAMSVHVRKEEISCAYILGIKVVPNLKVFFFTLMDMIIVNRDQVKLNKKKDLSKDFQSQ